jgi:CO/xanthine dehydrogenase Mo-binding subunit
MAITNNTPLPWERIPELSRRGFIKGGGALVVALSMPLGHIVAAKASSTAASKSEQLQSWLEIKADNSIILRTGWAEFGQGSVSTVYPMIAAEELRVPYERITDVIMGDTDVTPDGGASAGFIAKLLNRGVGTHPDSPFGRGALNVQKVAAYTYQALLGLASTKLGVPVNQLTVKDGVISGGSGKVTYGELVQGQQLQLKIPTMGTPFAGLTVTGNPPVVPVSQYKIIGQSIPMRAIPPKVTATAQYVADLKLPGMLHARMIHPKTLGSTLISAGTIDKAQFPTAQVVVKGNLVAVVSPKESEAIAASANVAATTKWTEWKGLPTSAKLPEALRAVDWKATPMTKGTVQGDVKVGFAAAVRKVSATFNLPYYKHAPIGPETTVAEARSDGSTHLWTHNQNSQALRKKIALMLGTSTDNVVVHWLEGAGNFGRTNGGAAGAEAEAVILSKAVGKPVRVQWMRQEDFMWATQQPPYLGDLNVGLNSAGKMISFQADHYQPVMQDDRLLGALLAGLPADEMGSNVNRIATEWPYDKVTHVLENGYGTGNLGQKASPIQVGIRDHSMRSPGHLQQNFGIEAMINEVAATVGADPIQYRLDHTTDQRLIAVLNALKETHGWQSRPSPSPNAKASGGQIVSGRGMGVTLRYGAYWAGAADITVNLSTGKVEVQRFTQVVDPGLAVNPRQLQRMTEGGTVMGLSHALLEEVQFDESGITSKDWKSYPILTMGETPEIRVKIINRPDLILAGMGGEAPNMVPPIAVAAAFFDATAKQARKLPLRPEYVKVILTS